MSNVCMYSDVFHFYYCRVTYVYIGDQVCLLKGTSVSKASLLFPVPDLLLQAKHILLKSHGWPTANLSMTFYV